MPRVIQEQLWKNPGTPGMIVVTTNSTIKVNGALVMGLGAAKEALVKIRGIDSESGAKLSAIFDGQRPGARGKYGFVIVRPPTEEKVGFGLFQVKRHFSATADYALIDYSARLLAGYAWYYPKVAIRLNYPGIGSGGLEHKFVRPLLEVLPDRVTVCHLGDG